MTDIIGVPVIKLALGSMPNSSGVYQMFDAAGEALYVGKAKNLKNRVTSYANLSGHEQRILRMIARVARIEIITTESEAAALLLEGNLVRRLKPHYNILLRDDKSFPCIVITGDHDFPQIRKHRGAQTQKGAYFGPFASAGAVNQTITILQRAFLLRSCTDSMFKSRTRPCLQYQIKRCSAPCVNYIGKEEYGALVEQSRDFLTGKSREIQQKLLAQMQQLSDELDYEKAGELRDRIKALSQVQREGGINAATLPFADIIALHREGATSCIQIYFFRGGQNFGNKSFFPSHSAESSEEEILAAFLIQFYQNHEPPKQIIISHPLGNNAVMEEALGMEAGHKVEIIHPQKGEKREVMEYALGNSKAALTRHLLEHVSQLQLLKEVGELFGLEAAPERIEVYDNSHIMGSNAVGAMIVAGPMGFDKKSYRKFNIKGLSFTPPLGGSRRDEVEPVGGENATYPPPHRPALPDSATPPQGGSEKRGGDDYAMLREVLTRRLVKLESVKAGAATQWPDLLLIDGGAGHLTTATQVMNELAITTIPYVCIAKGVDRNAGREWLHMPGREPFQLPQDAPVLHFLQRLRDEAHRFAIGTHRAKRSKQTFTSPLDAIEGIGPTRKKALLHHFGSARDVSSASLADLEQVPGISKKTAKLVFDHFHG